MTFHPRRNVAVKRLFLQMLSVFILLKWRSSENKTQISDKHNRLAINRSQK